MEYITVKELFKITKGKKVEEIDYKNKNSIRYIQIDDLRNNNNIKHCENINKYVIAKKEDIIIAWDGANAGTIGFGIEGAIGSTLAILRKENKEMDTEFCGLFLRSKSAYLREKCTGATIPHIQRRSLEDIKIPQIPLNKQIEIKNIINKSQELIDKRKEQIEALDELVKSQFIEVFGDPVKNPLGWELKPFLESGNCKNGMNFSATETGIELRYLGVGDFKDLSKIEDTNNLGKVSLNKMPSSEYLLQDGDIVFVRSNGNKALVGRCLAVYPNGVATTYSGFCIRYRKTDENLEIPYLLQVLKTDSMRKNMAGRGANIQNLNQQILGALMIPVPPLELQKQFTDFIEQVDKLKFEMEKSLKELEDNFNSLMQKAFKGELFN